ncbi:winged helix-turn-helix domain-containing protein [Chelatococcus sp. SYSU_G07232]|uniref:Winged helix-turn-helix domain-containing protein n=1 Tax=Chelatococcus albus TaxID=3047466 RepID=A0ABT7AD12_9HYPH|nr:winged helix-turn-helix domain-containing protein [Chelatococcus sp. SYSU_G07232]MDJ1157258.1 winged helix-turn-helix domain-containing protein [Chelatococcus sp. SYSU_G07232]
MKEGPSIAPIAALIGDPARANMLTALMAGRALTASELAAEAGVTLQTASGHLARLESARLLVVEKQGRHRYFRLSEPDVAQVLENLMGIAARAGLARVRTGPRDHALRKARVCYDHLAGERGVALLRGLDERRLIADEGTLALTEAGRRFFCDFGIDLERLERSRRPLCRACLDWSERRHHLGGALGAAILARLCDLGWARRGADRVVTFSPRGEHEFARVLAAPLS